MPMLLGVPGVRLRDDYDEQVASSESDGSLKVQSAEGNRTVSSRTERTVYVSVKTYRVYSRTSEQDISLVIRVDFESRSVTLELKTSPKARNLYGRIR